MNITFFIGNGFDLNLGLKTRYTDFLAEYVKGKHEDALSKAIKEDYETWADLEKQLGIYAGGFSEDDAAQFNADREALEESLIEYLRDVSLNEMVIDDGGAEFQKMVTGFSDCLPAVEQEHYRTIIAKTREALRYRFIDFNYTRYLDKLVEEAKKINPFGSHTGGGTHYTDEIMIPIHIHGELDDELLLGVNDKTQIGDGKGDPIPAIAEYLIKPNVNRKLGNQKIAQVEEIIDKSMFVCVFGMSLGETDKDWWCCLGKWLEQSPDRRLVLFMYEGPGLITSGSRRTRLEDRYRSRFIDMIGKTDIADQLGAQITVVLNSWIFKFEHVKMKPFSADAGTDGSR